jgi:hypothetical protein
MPILAAVLLVWHGSWHFARELAVQLHVIVLSPFYLCEIRGQSANYGIFRFSGFLSTEVYIVYDETDELGKSPITPIWYNRLCPPRDCAYVRKSRVRGHFYYVEVTY